MCLGFSCFTCNKKNAVLSLLFTKLSLNIFSVRKRKKQIWCRWTGSHTTLWGEDRLFFDLKRDLEPGVLKWYLHDTCMETCVVPRHPSLVRAVGILHGLCFRPFYSQNSTAPAGNKAVFTGVGKVCVNTYIHNQLNYWIFLVYFNLKLAEWKACLDGEYEARVRRKNKKIRGRQAKHGYISR